jgi:hypothetical protein
MHLFSLLLLSGSIFGCMDKEETENPEEPADTQEPADTDEPTDTQEPTDTGEPTDTQEPTDTGEPTDTQDPADTGEPTDTQDPADTGEPTDTQDPADTSDPGPCGSQGICEIPVMDVESMGCGGESDPSSITATADLPGQLEVFHDSAYFGCCPSVSAEAELDLSSATLTVSYQFADDMCDCICMLSVGYTLTDIPAGSYTLEAQSDSLQVVVE